MYRNVLLTVAPDHGPDDCRSLQAARLLAGEEGQITVLSVIEPIPPYATTYLPEDHAEKARQDLAVDLNRSFGGDPRITIRTCTGHVSHGILDFADRHGVDCIVIASHRPGLQDYLIGSTAARIVRHAGCAVHVLR